MNARRFLLSLSLAVMAATLCGRAADAATFKWANDGDVRAMDPYTLDEAVQNGFLANIYERLVQRNKTLGLEPGLAVSWKQTSPLVWRFKLRPNVKWQNGTPFTADDVVFSFQRVTAKNSQKAAEVATIKSVTKVDPLTVDITTRGPDPLLPGETTNWDIMSKAWCEKHGSVENVQFGSGSNYALSHAMGTGPYKLVSREPDRRTVIERNPLWWGHMEGNVDRAEFTVISNAATRVAALLSGEMDMIYSVPVQDMKQIAHTPGFKLIEHPELRTIFLGMDQSRSQLLFSSVKGKNPFKDVRVRRAFALAIDENAIVSHVLDGMGHATWEMWGPGVNGYDPAIDKRPAVDLAKAKALLKAAGYPNGFEVTLDCTNDRYVADAQICTAIASMLARIDIKVDVYARTKVKFFADLASPGFKSSFYMLGWTPSTYDAENVLKSLIDTREPDGTGLYNVGGYSNPQVDALSHKIESQLDPKKRDAEIAEAAKIVQDDVGYIPLHQQVIVWAAKKNVEVVQPGDDSFSLRWVTVK